MATPQGSVAPVLLENDVNNLSDHTSMPFDCHPIPYNNRKALELLIARCYADHMEELMTFLNQQQSPQPSTWILTIILFLFALLIFIGGCGNFLVIYVVATQKKMRTPRNVFIVNLAISDMSFCLVTQPFNLLKLFGGVSGWHLGDFMCKFTAIFQGTNIFVSTITITAIALDRFQVIVYPTRSSMQCRGAVLVVSGIWITAILLAGPTFFFTEIAASVHDENMTICQEKEMDSGKLVYSTFALVFQYIIPLITVAVTYSLITQRINHRMVNSNKTKYQLTRPSDAITCNSVMETAENQQLDFPTSSSQRQNPVVAKRMSQVSNHHHATEQEDSVFTSSQRRALAEKRRQRRASLLLLSIACLFAISWLPLNINNIVMDARSKSLAEDYHTTELEEKATKSKSEEVTISPQNVFIIHSLCLLVVLSSACLNPVLYGWLNENFRTEFVKVFNQCRACCPTTCRHSVPSNGGSPQTLVEEYRLPQLKRLAKEEERLIDKSNVAITEV